MMFRWIGYRTLKTVISAVCAMYIAYFIGLPSYTPAGLIAIISVQNTTKKSLDYAVQRFIAAFVGLLLAAFSLLFGTRSSKTSRQSALMDFTSIYLSLYLNSLLYAACEVFVEGATSSC